MVSEEEDAVGNRRWGCSNKCASENMNMKMYSDPVAELFSSTLMSAATLVTLPKAAQVFRSFCHGLECFRR